MKKSTVSIYFFLLTSFILISCNGSTSYKTNHPDLPKAVDKKTLVTMVSQLHRALNVKDYSAEKGLNVIRPYLSKYKVCIPGFSKIVPYNEQYLYVYCIYDTVETPPRVLSYRFQLPKQLQQQVVVDDIKKPFKEWKPDNTITNTDSTTSNTYNAGGENLSITLTQQTLPNRRGKIITDLIVSH